MAIRFPDTPHPVDPVEIDIQNSHNSLIDMNAISYMIQVGKIGRKPGELSCPRGVAIDDNSGNIYVTEFSPSRVSIFSDSGEFLNSITHVFMKGAYGIAIHRNNLYVSDTGVHGVFHFKIGSDMRLVDELVGKGSDDGKFNSPRQLTVSHTGEVFVADYFNHRIQILDESLHFKRSIIHDSMQHPLDVKLTNKEVFVLCHSSPCIIVFSNAGAKLRSFITSGEGMEVSNPWFLYLDAQQNLIMNDGAKYVKTFSPDGRLIYSVGTQLYSVWEGFAITKQFKIVSILNNGTFRLQIISSNLST